ncbi:MAG: helix-turn-helix domain-containing protein [Clostridia bacterium]|nr:helix-turn-helix domain-containing protein [Clostridia bacterium]
MMNAPTILTVPEAADLLKVSAWSVYEMVRQKKIPALRIGRAIRIPLEGLLESLASAPELEPQEQDLKRDLIAEARQLYRRQVQATERALSALWSCPAGDVTPERRWKRC